MAEHTPDEASLSYLTWGGAAMIAIALLGAGVASQTGIGVTRLETVLAGESRDLRMVESHDGGVIVTDLGQPDRTWIVRPSNGEGFVQVVVQGLMRTRVQAGIDAEQPFRLIRQADGRLWLQDLSTHQQLAIDAFGPVSARTFVKFIDSDKERP